MIDYHSSFKFLPNLWRVRIHLLPSSQVCLQVSWELAEDRRLLGQRQMTLLFIAREADRLSAFAVVQLPQGKWRGLGGDACILSGLHFKSRAPSLESLNVHKVCECACPLPQKDPLFLLYWAKPSLLWRETPSVSFKAICCINIFEKIVQNRFLVPLFANDAKKWKIHEEVSHNDFRKELSDRFKFWSLINYNLEQDLKPGCTSVFFFLIYKNKTFGNY